MNLDLLAQTPRSFWLPEGASTYSDQVDRVFYFILGVTIFFFVLILLLMVWFVWRYRGREDQPARSQVSHSTTLELTWTIPPLVLVVIIFVMGFRGYMNMAVSPANAYEIGVTGVKWAWSFTYPNGHVDPELHVPVNRPIRLVLTSADVIHSLYIPAFRVKRDAVPGRYNTVWFEATQIRDQKDRGYDVLCAEYCGTNHSTMRTYAYVHDPTDFERWLESASNWEGRMTPAERGAEIHAKRGCIQCHTLDGSRLIGPTFKNIWKDAVEGNVTFRDGTRLSNLLGPDYSPEDYIRESILNPAARIVAGYDNVMPSYKGSLKDNDITAVIAFLKNLSGMEDEAPAATAPAP